MEHQFIHIHCEHCGNMIDVPVYCGNRFCGVCAPARHARIADRLRFLVKNTPRKPVYALKFLTLTIANMPNLEPMVAFMVKCFRKLRNRAVWKKYVDGGAFVIEVTGRPGNWHAHIHAIIFARYINRDSLVKAWKSISNGIGVDIRQITTDALCNHLIKYLSKRQEPEMITDEKNLVLKSYRLFQPFGCWFKLQKKYKRAKHPCEKCGESAWTPWDIAQGFFIDSFWKEIDVGEPVRKRDLVSEVRKDQVELVTYF